MGKVVVVDPTYANTKATVVELHGDFEDEVERAALLVEAVLEHRGKIHHRLLVKEKLDLEREKIADEIARGLRCEIPIDADLMGMVMGHKGSRVRAAQEACAVGAIVVDRDAGVIRVVGSDPAEVRKARSMLELRREIIATPDDKTRRILIGKGGKTIDDIQRRSGALSIDVDHDKGRVVVLGNANATSAARVLIESHMETIADLDAAADDLEELRGEIRNLNVAWGRGGGLRRVRVPGRVRRPAGRPRGRGARRQRRRIRIGRRPRRPRRVPRRERAFSVPRRERADAFRRSRRPRRPRRPRRRA
jgi:fragile X mental retardation protein